MSPFRSEVCQPSQLLAVQMALCPCVADLIDFAQGRIGSEDRQHIESHLHSTGCPQCRSWIAKSASHPADTSLTTPDRLIPTADNIAWQRQAFQNLEKRLQMLEEA